MKKTRPKKAKARKTKKRPRRRTVSRKRPQTPKRRASPARRAPEADAWHSAWYWYELGRRGAQQARTAPRYRGQGKSFQFGPVDENKFESCAYCRTWTTMKSYTKEGLRWPACCSRPACIDQWGPSLA